VSQLKVKYIAYTRFPHVAVQVIARAPARHIPFSKDWNWFFKAPRSSENNPRCNEWSILQEYGILVQNISSYSCSSEHKVFRFEILHSCITFVPNYVTFWKATSIPKSFIIWNRGIKPLNHWQRPHFFQKYFRCSFFLFIIPSSLILKKKFQAHFFFERPSSV
jgi:hypothetical protein